MKISIIIPVFQAEVFLRPALESVRKQTFRDWECLLVDDGSTDESSNICDYYSSIDSRFITFHKKNEGVSTTRNYALDRISGDWVTFLDADDLLEEHALEILYNTIVENKLDLLQFQVTKDIALLGQIGDQKSRPCKPCDYISNDYIVGSIGGNIIKTKVIQDNHIRFNDIMKLAEDQLFIFSCIAHASWVRLIPNYLYYYRDNCNSATNNEKISDIVSSALCCIQFKESFPEFSKRIDDLVLWYMEKLFRRKSLRQCYQILNVLKPTFYKKRPWPTRVMAYLSKYNMVIALGCWTILYPLYILSEKFGNLLNA